jgi:DhnA family fructose-bisphosphate aldolase class Ia
MKPLDGIRVLDLSRVLAGPYATALMADLGAEIIKIEPPQGDDYRHIGPFRDGESALFTLNNRGKQSLALDLKDPAHLRIAQAIAARVDVVVENFRPGVAARITVMTNHNRTFNGVVDSVGSGVLPEGGSVIEGLPLIQKSINWVHVSQRFPVKIAVSDPDPALFRMGASASAVLQP